MHYKVLRLYDAKNNITSEDQTYNKIVLPKSLLDVELHDCKITEHCIFHHIC
jgi:hypothetical protein